MTATPTILPLLESVISTAADVVRARRDARQLADAVGMGSEALSCFATAVGEIAMHAHACGAAAVRFSVERRSGDGQWLVARVAASPTAMRDFDATPSSGDVANPEADVVAATQIVAHFHYYRADDGATVFELGHPLPASAQPFGPADAARVAGALPPHASLDAVSEARHENRELLRAISAGRRHEMQIEWLNGELEATNRGVMALYAELEDRAEDLKRASEHKTRFLSDVSHELRTPMTSVLNLARLLLDRTDGPLTEEQERQVELIQQSVQTVSGLVNDLLDIARIEAGHSTLRYRAVTVRELLAALRGISRPLLTSDAVNLSFDDDESGTVLETDDTRLAQILRNLLSNAIKFTERGEISVSARVEIGDMVRFDVRDTGIGIAAADQERIFEEFTQIDSRLQRRVHGSGLGLRLSRTLATLLGGRIELVSAPGRGSTFSVIVPRRHSGWAEQPAPNEPAPHEATV